MLTKPTVKSALIKFALAKFKMLAKARASPVLMVSPLISPPEDTIAFWPVVASTEILLLILAWLELLIWMVVSEVELPLLFWQFEEQDESGPAIWSISCCSALGEGLELETNVKPVGS